ncbi:MAG TPA: fibronectin type III domain-containing protein [Burkholderiaceae bacterium]|nr:fibronectin type III domain-containing protein [Burkholderiaceae bacterium]
MPIPAILKRTVIGRRLTGLEVDTNWQNTLVAMAAQDAAITSAATAASTAQLAADAAAAAAASVGAPTVRVAASTTIPLDAAGNGKAMPLTAGQTIAVTADLTPTLGSGAVEGGACVVDYLADATHNLLLPNFLAKGDAWTPEAGRKYRVTYAIIGGDAWAIVAKGTISIVDTVAPLIGTPHVESGAPAVAVFPLTDASPLTLNGGITGIVPGGAGLGGRTVIAAAIVGSNLNVTFSSALVWNSVVTLALPVGKVSDSAGNLSAAMGATTVTNNIAIPAPNAPTLAFSASTTASLQVGFTAGAVDSTHGPATAWQPYFRTGVGAFTAFGSPLPVSTASVTITGLAASTSYDIKAASINGAGNSVDSNVVTHSTDAAAPAGRLDNFLLISAAENPHLVASDGLGDWYADGSRPIFAGDAGGMVYGIGAGETAAILAGNVGADHTVTLNGIKGGSFPYGFTSGKLKLYFRYADTDNHGYIQFENGGTGFTTLISVAGSPVPVSGTIPGGLSADNLGSLRAVCSGTSVLIQGKFSGGAWTDIVTRTVPSGLNGVNAGVFLQTYDYGNFGPLIQGDFAITAT